MNSMMLSPEDIQDVREILIKASDDEIEMFKEWFEMEFKMREIRKVLYPQIDE